MASMTPHTWLSNVALHRPSSCIGRTLAASLLALLLDARSSTAFAAGGTTPLPMPANPLPSNGGKLDSWAAAGTVDAAGLANEYCNDRAADSAAYAVCKQNVIADSSTCSQQCASCDPRHSALRYEACMDSSLFESPCAEKTRDRFWKEALDHASSGLPMAWDKGWSCKEKKKTEDVLWTSFWDQLCSKNTSAACFPPPKKTDKKSSLLRVSTARHTAGQRRSAYLNWLRQRLPMALRMPKTCQDTAAVTHDEENSKRSVRGRALFQAMEAAHLQAEKPVGEGAYQSHKAVKERTTDKNTHCEDQKWGPCYSHDYIDKRGSPPAPNPPAPKKSGAPKVATILGFVLAASSFLRC